MSSSRSSNGDGSTTSSEQESSLGSPAAAAAARSLLPPAIVNRQQRTAQQAATVRQQFAILLSEHFDALEAAYDDGSAGEVVDQPDTPCSGKGGHGRRFRGVTKHKRTQRFESHIWEMKKQIYLGGFDSEPLAAKAHDVMALRCKDCSAEDRASSLNFPRSQYAGMLPVISQLSREDVVTALRNYSKGQTSRRLGSLPPPPPSPRARACAPALATANGGVHKSSPRAAAARRLPTAPSAAAGQGRKLSVSVATGAGSPRARKLATASDEGTLASRGSTGAQPGSPRSGGGYASPKSVRGKVAPRGRVPPAVSAAAAAAAAAQPPSPLKQRMAAGGGHPSRSAGSDLTEPATPHSVHVETAAPVTPSAAVAAALVAAGGGGGGPAGARLPLGRQLRWQASLSGSNTASGTYLGPAVGVTAAPATGRVLCAPKAEAHWQYLSEMYSQYHAGTGASVQPAYTHCQQQQQQQQQVVVVESTEASRGAAAFAAATGLFAAGHGVTIDGIACTTAELEDMMDVEGCAFNRLLEEPSLTFSASDDAYLFSPTEAHTPGGASLEHVNGTVLFQEEQAQQAQQAQQALAAQQESDSGSGGFTVVKPLPEWAAMAAPVGQAEGGWLQSVQPATAHGHPFDLAAGFASFPTLMARPTSPGHVVTVLPATSVPAPPFSTAAPPLAHPAPAMLDPARSATAAALRQASLQQALQLAALQQQHWQYAGEGDTPFAAYAAAGAGPASSLYLA